MSGHDSVSNNHFTPFENAVINALLRDPQVAFRPEIAAVLREQFSKARRGRMVVSNGVFQLQIALPSGDVPLVSDLRGTALGNVIVEAPEFPYGAEFNLYIDQRGHLVRLEGSTIGDVAWGGEPDAWEF